MEYIKTFVTTLVTMLILMTAIELIAPDNSMKKYIKFVLGLMLIAVMLSPIVSILTNAEDSVHDKVSEFLNLEKNDYVQASSSYYESNEFAFKNNLEQNLNKLLKEKFKDNDFTVNIDSKVDMKDINYSIEKVEIIVKDKGVAKIQKIIINSKEEEKELNDVVENEDEIKKYICEILNIKDEQILVYKS